MFRRLTQALVKTLRRDAAAHGPQQADQVESGASAARRQSPVDRALDYDDYVRGSLARGIAVGDK